MQTKSHYVEPINYLAQVIHFDMDNVDGILFTVLTVAQQSTITTKKLRFSDESSSNWHVMRENKRCGNADVL